MQLDQCFVLRWLSSGLHRNVDCYERPSVSEVCTASNISAISIRELLKSLTFYTVNI
jgi:hypothetical protein